MWNKALHSWTKTNETRDRGRKGFECTSRIFWTTKSNGTNFWSCNFRSLSCNFIVIAFTVTSVSVLVCRTTENEVQIQNNSVCSTWHHSPSQCFFPYQKFPSNTHFKKSKKIRTLRDPIKPWTRKGNSKSSYNDEVDNLIFSCFPLHPRISESNACINEIMVDEIRGKYLQSICIPFGKALTNEESCKAMNAFRDRPHTHDGVIRHRSDGVLHSVEVFSERHRLLFAEMLHVALELRWWQISVDPVIPQIPFTPQRTSCWRLWRFSWLPNADNSLW